MIVFSFNALRLCRVLKYSPTIFEKAIEFPLCTKNRREFRARVIH